MKLAMFRPIKVVDIEVSRPLETIEGLDGYESVQVLVRLHGAPLGYVKAPLTVNRCTAATLGRAILDKLSWPILRHLLNDGLAMPSLAGGLRLADLLDVPHLESRVPLPLVTIAVCTRDRTADLVLCLEALNRLDYPALDLMVVDNAPTSDATEHLVRSYPNIRYVCEPRPGLDWARNRAILEARGEIIAYTDDDVVVDPGWVKALATIFAENPEVMAVTGLVVPYELETEAQWLFELYGGFGRGFERKWYRMNQEQDPLLAHGAGRFGTGANMAYRRCVFEQLGLFDPALDVGTVTNGGGDLEIFFRVLKEGHTLVYEPSAIVRHRHRREDARLQKQLTDHGIGFCAYMVRSALAYPDERLAFLRLTQWWMVDWMLRRLAASWTRPLRFPRKLILAELWGFFVGLGRYPQARRAVAEIARTFGPVTPALAPQPPPVRLQATSKHCAVRAVNLSQPLPDLKDVAGYVSVRAFVSWSNRLLGHVDIANQGQPVSAARLRQAIAEQLQVRLLEPERDLNLQERGAQAIALLSQRYLSNKAGEPTVRLPANSSASVVLATRDRPDDLRACLRALAVQESPRRVEIVVVDNNPNSGLTPPVITEFPGVVLASEPRQGLSYARNAGIVASTGDIVIAIDDDVTMLPDWLEKLVAPFVRPAVMVVTGNVLPLELETEAQSRFESYGGLGRGYERREVDREWFASFRFRALPTWELGATANAAFRATIFSHPQIGLLDEALGVGTPTGCSEDTDLFYRVLKAGYTIIYEPTAYVWHRHRRDLPALRRQIYNYSKGHVAYHLTTLFRDHDLRALVRLGYELPKVYLWRIKERLRGRSDYPMSLMLLEVAGNLAGPWALWQSRRRVRHEGRSAAYVPVEARASQSQPQPAAS